MVFPISFMLTCSYIHTSSFEKHYFLPEATAAVGKSLIFLDIRANNLMSRGKAGHQTREWYHWADLSIFVLTFKLGDQFIVMYFIHCCIITPNHSIQRSSKIMENIGEELILGLQRFLNYLMFLTLLRSIKESTSIFYHSILFFQV